MSAVNDILSRVPIDQLANELGTDPATAEQAARGAIATLMGGLQSNATDPDGEASLAGALEQHASRGLFQDGSVDLSAVDTTDGAKIVQHVLGSNEGQDIQALSGGLLGNAKVQQLLRILAPIVLGYLAGQVTSGKYGDILGDILGGGKQQQPEPTQAPEPKRGGGILGDILGQILGGGAAAQDAPAQPQAQAPADSPFNTPDLDAPAGQTFPTDATADAAQSEEARRAEAERKDEGGGILGDILGGIFGKK